MLIKPALCGGDTKVFEIQLTEVVLETLCTRLVLRE
jgi:hypothetical protein